MNHAYTQKLAKNSILTQLSNIRLANMFAVLFTPTILRVSLVCSKKGMRDVYQHCGESHLHRYLAEFEFRFNRRTALKVSGRERRDDLLSMIGGKRLTYQRINEAALA
jgi:hypothetical protein